MSLTVSKLFSVLFFSVSLLNKPSGANRGPTTPTTRKRGEIGCYSCVSLADNRSNGSAKHLPSAHQWLFSSISSPSNIPARFNATLFGEMFRAGGMRMPKVTSRCAETHQNERPNFLGAQLRFCRNTPEHPGACVKLKGLFDGHWFVYRECWDRMWLDPRPFHHSLSGHCYADQLVQQFVASERNVICFCEEDMCNRGPGPRGIITIPAIFMLIATTALKCLIYAFIFK